MLKKIYLVIQLGVFGMMSDVYAQPTNDDPCNAIPLTANSSCSYSSYTNIGASGTSTVTAPSCGNYNNSNSKDVWFTVVVPASGNVTIDTQAGSLTDSGMAIYSGTCGSLTLIECDENDSPNGDMSLIAANGLTPGTTIWIRVWGFGNKSGTFGICAFLPPAGVGCSNATSLPCGTGALAGTTAGTTDVPHGTGCSMSNYGTWYSFVGNGQQTTISVLPQTGFDPEISISSGSCGALTNIVCKDDSASGGVESYTFTATSGVTYFVYVAYYGTGNTTGTFTISRNCSDPPVVTVPGGVVCDDAEPFCSGSYMFPNTTGGTYAQTGPNYACLGSGTPNPIWYYMEIEIGGTMQMTISQEDASGMGLDVDFAMWGPFTSHENACTNIENATAVPIQSSFSTASTEIVGLGLPGGSNSICSGGNGSTTPPAAIAGQLYVVMITNWDGDPGYITFSQTGGTATTNCAIVELGGEISSFFANHQAAKRANILNWIVNQEMNVSHYELKRSTDGQNWTTIHSTTSKNVFHSDKHYSETDTDFEVGINYYQVHSISYDGTSKLSKIITVDNSQDTNDAKLVKMVNTLGQEVDDNYRGLVIYIYSDGSTIKKYNDKN